VTAGKAFFITVTVLSTAVCANCARRGTVGEEGPYREGKVVEGELRGGSSESTSYEYGFRVQLYATRDVEKAKKVAESARNIFSMQTYIEYQDPYYKVRLGDFRTREEAERMRYNVTSGGFEDAWIVETTIRTSETP
jgi:hypothetical protein